MILEPWQVFVLSTAFGWVDAEGNRRFRRVYVEVPRGNGKSSFSSPVGLYMLALDGEAGAEVYSAATTRDQARIVFRDAQAMARKMPGYPNRFGVDVTAQAIVQLKSSSAFKALSAEGHTLDGLNIHLAIVDELHAHKNRDVYDVLETGLGKRPQSMLWMITTAGSNKHGICYEVRKFVLDVLAGHVSGEAAEAVFGIIYTIDEGDDPFSEETLRKANPNWGVSVDPKIVMQTAGKARQVATARANYLTKHLNVWVDANSALFDTEWWRKCEDRTLDEADFAEDECVIGLDLASKIDIAARVNTYRRLIDGKAHYYVFPRFYLPRVAIDEDRHPMYRGWEMQGDIVATAGETIDFSIIEDDIRAEAPSLNLQAVATDPWQAQQMIQNLKRDGMPAEEYRQTVATMSEATKTLDALMREGRIHHTGNAVMNWMIGNVVGHYDAKENVYPRKEMPQNKIDGAVALIMSLGWFIQQEAEYDGIDDYFKSLAGAA
ncbi:terminase large subunit [Brucella intermedia]|uniref:terminase large subunit n=1 Tax=Brucella intermedia TaxID=94625 RepID=UPI001AF022AC|nr:terminase TerL endonuclease subunit [Brucella intermedia]